MIRVRCSLNLIRVLEQNRMLFAELDAKLEADLRISQEWKECCQGVAGPLYSPYLTITLAETLKLTIVTLALTLA